MGKLPDRFHQPESHKKQSKFAQKHKQTNAVRLKVMCQSLNEEAKTKEPEMIAVVDGKSSGDSSSKTSSRMLNQKLALQGSIQKALEELDKSVKAGDVSKDLLDLLQEDMVSKERELQELIIKRKIARFYILAYRINQLYNRIVEMCKEPSSEPMETLAYCFLESKDICQLIIAVQDLILDPRWVYTQ